jgi:hypothetical protein
MGNGQKGNYLNAKYQLITKSMLFVRKISIGYICPPDNQSRKNRRTCMKYKLNLYLLFFFALLFINTDSFAQIKGMVMDHTTHQPVIGASIYVANTTYGCQSNIDGLFELQSLPAPPFQIIISSVGYESASLNIDNKQLSGVTITLKAKATDLNEVVILAPEKSGWELYGKDFIRDFIGYSAFSNDCEILNKKDIEFRYDKKTSRLMVSARRPLKIKNKATGYLLTYWLEDYEKDYFTGRLYYKGNIQFEPLQSKKEKVNHKWKTNRESAFNGSINHFMRSVYNNTIYEDSFELRVYKRIPTAQYGKTVPFRKDILFAGNDSLITQALKDYLHIKDSNIIKSAPDIAKWLQPATTYQFSLEESLSDTIQKVNRKMVFNYNAENPKEKWIEYYDYQYIPVDSAYEQMIAKEKFIDPNGVTRPVPRRKLPEVMTYLWTQKMPLDSFVTRTPDHKVILKFKDYIHVTYLKEKEESAYLNGQFPHTHFIPEQQQSLITLENPGGVYVQSDGNFFEAYDLTMEEYWSYEKMDKMLPLDYKKTE